MRSFPNRKLPLVTFTRRIADEEVDGTDIDEEENIVDDDAYDGILSMRLALLEEKVEERERRPMVEASWWAQCCNCVS